MSRTPPPQRFSRVDGAWTVVRLGPDAPVPAWALSSSPFVSITRTLDELSVVCLESAVPVGLQAEPGWALLKLHGPIPFGQVGVLAAFAAPLAAAGISLFAVSTFDTDYILVKASQGAAACEALVSAGHEFVPK